MLLSYLCSDDLPLALGNPSKGLGWMLVSDLVDWQYKSHMLIFNFLRKCQRHDHGSYQLILDTLSPEHAVTIYSSIKVYCFWGLRGPVASIVFVDGDLVWLGNSTTIISFPLEDWGWFVAFALPGLLSSVCNHYVRFLLQHE